MERCGAVFLLSDAGCFDNGSALYGVADAVYMSVPSSVEKEVAHIVDLVFIDTSGIAVRDGIQARWRHDGRVRV